MEKKKSPLYAFIIYMNYYQNNKNYEWKNFSLTTKIPEIYKSPRLPFCPKLVYK